MIVAILEMSNNAVLDFKGTQSEEYLSEVVHILSWHFEHCNQSQLGPFVVKIVSIALGQNSDSSSSNYESRLSTIGTFNSVSDELVSSVALALRFFL